MFLKLPTSLNKLMTFNVQRWFYAWPGMSVCVLTGYMWSLNLSRVISSFTSWDSVRPPHNIMYIIVYDIFHSFASDLSSAFVRFLITMQRDHMVEISALREIWKHIWNKSYSLGYVFILILDCVWYGMLLPRSLNCCITVTSHPSHNHSTMDGGKIQI